MAASLRFFSVTPQSLNRLGDGAVSVSTLFSHISFNPLPKVVSSLSYNAKPIWKFARKVSISSDFDEDVEEEVEEDASNFNFPRPREPGFSPDLKLFVGNLPFNVDSAALAGIFEQAGDVEMVEVIYDKETGRSRGFGFVTMSTIEEAEAAAQQFNGYELDGRPLRVNSGPPPPRRENFAFQGSRPRMDNFSSRGPRGRGSIDNTNRVHVGNLDWGVDNDTLENLFSKQGNVKEATVIYDRENGRSKGFGFVTLSSPDEVVKAIRSLDGADLNGRSIRVSEAGAAPSRRDY